MPRFLQIVDNAWNSQCDRYEPFHKLYHKLGTTAKKLREWSNDFYPDAKMQLLMASDDVILRLDTAQESRPLTNEELILRQKLKRRVMGLAALERV